MMIIMFCCFYLSMHLNDYWTLDKTMLLSQLNGIRITKEME